MKTLNILFFIFFLSLLFPGCQFKSGNIKSETLRVLKQTHRQEKHPYQGIYRLHKGSFSKYKFSCGCSVKELQGELFKKHSQHNSGYRHKRHTPSFDVSIGVKHYTNNMLCPILHTFGYVDIDKAVYRIDTRDVKYFSSWCYTFMKDEANQYKKLGELIYNHKNSLVEPIFNLYSHCH